MALKVPTVGENLMLGWAISSTSVPEDLTLHLYQNDYTPVDGSVDTDFSEANFTNYTSKSLTRSGWNAVAQNSNAKAEIQYGTVQSWTCGATGNTIYGYYITGSTSGTLIWAERFGSAQVLVENEDLDLTIKLTLNSES